MLEIIILFVLAGKIGKIVESKGRKKTGYQFMLVGMWIGGEIGGALLGVVIAAAAGAEDGGGLLIFALALGGAITGAVMAFQIAKNAAPVESEDDYYRGIEYADRLRAGEHFGDRPATAPPVTDAITDGGDKTPCLADERIQE